MNLYRPVGTVWFHPIDGRMGIVRLSGCEFHRCFRNEGGPRSVAGVFKNEAGAKSLRPIRKIERILSESFHIDFSLLALLIALPLTFLVSKGVSAKLELLARLRLDVAD